MHRWSPPSQIPVTSLDYSTTLETRRMCLRWCKLVIFILILLSLISFVIVYPLQKESLFRQKHQHEQDDEFNRRQQSLFEIYIKDISNTLSQMSDEKFLDIRSKTLTLLRTLEAKRKKDVILFLYERNLLQNNRSNLYGADFDNVELICPHDFHRFYVAGVSWSHATFINCPLTAANFDNVFLMHARFINSTIRDASFVNAKLDYSHFIRTNVRDSNFNRASLVQANFLQVDVMQGNNFSNADLYQAKLTNEQLEGKKVSIIKHDFYHARYPNGSFESLNSKENLIRNGDAEMECLATVQTIWTTDSSHHILSTKTIENRTNNTEANSEYDWGNCSFVISNKARIYQNIDLDSYSLLIDTHNAAVSFFGFASCNQSYFEIHMFRSDGILHDSKIYKNPGKQIEASDDISMYSYEQGWYQVPANTRLIRIYFGIETMAVPNFDCYFDNIFLNIDQIKNNTSV